MDSRRRQGRPGTTVRSGQADIGSSSSLCDSPSRRRTSWCPARRSFGTAGLQHSKHARLEHRFADKRVSQLYVTVGVIVHRVDVMNSSPALQVAVPQPVEYVHDDGTLWQVRQYDGQARLAGSVQVAALTEVQRNQHFCAPSNIEPWFAARTTTSATATNSRVNGNVCLMTRDPRATIAERFGLTS